LKLQINDLKGKRKEKIIVVIIKLFLLFPNWTSNEFVTNLTIGKKYSK